MRTRKKATAFPIARANNFRYSGKSYGLHYLAILMALMFAGNISAQVLDGSITDTYSRAAVIGQGHAGGLAGRASGNVAIQHTYSTGLVRGNQNGPGGLIGSTAGNVAITGSYWDADASGCENSAAGESRNTEQMAQIPMQDTYTGWDFTAIWTHDSNQQNSGYPCLSQILPKTFTLTLQTSQSQAGILTGMGNYGRGTLVPLRAIPNEGFAFVSWTTAGSAILSTLEQFDYSMPDSDMMLNANFSETTTVPDISPESLLAFPNPFRDMVYVLHPEQYNCIKVYNMIGECILTLPMPQKGMEISTVDLPGGLYLFSFTGHDETQEVRKMIKQ